MEEKVVTPQEIQKEFPELNDEQLAIIRGWVNTAYSLGYNLGTENANYAMILNR